MRSVLAFWSGHADELLRLFAQHVVLVAASTVVACVVAIPLGIFASRSPRLAAPLTAIAGVVQTVPSLAMFGFLLPVPLLGGVGPRAALVVLILYGLLPILRTTIAGLRTIDGSILEAADAIGMTRGERLRLVELPLALPAIVAGVRVAAVVGVGSATIAAAIGAGGLGEYIYRGLSMVDTTVILAGAIPAAALAVAVDGLLLATERALSARRRRGRPVVVATAAVILALTVMATARAARRGEGAIVVGSKNFTEQLILGELVAQAIEQAGLPVERRLNLGGTLICDRATRTGDIDAYVEYTGTALTAVFHRNVVNDGASVFETVRQEYARTGRALLAGLGFNNTFAILVRGADARRLGLRTIDDAARESPHWRAGFGYEFMERPDGYSGLAKTYALRFPVTPGVMDLTLSYRALASGQVDLIAGDSTAGLIQALDLVQLDDTRHYFPPYDAAIVVRSEALHRQPALRSALERLSGRVSTNDMRAMNYAADVEHRDVAAIAAEFLSRAR
jgi:osmoprotectant transport system substrate-binding protein/osmoprotectant transport system permease protein